MKANSILFVLVVMLSDALIFSSEVLDRDERPGQGFNGNEEKRLQLDYTPQPRFFFGKYFNLPASVWRMPCASERECCRFKCTSPCNMACALVRFPVNPLTALYCSATTGGVAVAPGMLCRETRTCGECANIQDSGFTCATSVECSVLDVGTVCRQPPPPYK